MPNSIAYLALLLWPLVCIAIFRRTDITRAIIWCFLGGYLLLPPVANLNLPLLPPLDKTTIPSLCVVALCLAKLGPGTLALPSSVSARMLLAVFVLGAIPTVLANTEPVTFTTIPNSTPLVLSAWELPGLKLRDVISVLGNQVLALLPFLLARKFLATENGMRQLLRALVAAALVYSIPALIEIRLSPQINTWVYGFFQHDFIQMMRAGGFRPIVFFPHSLWLAFFIVTALLGAACLAASAGNDQRVRMVFVVLYLAGLLYLCKSLASLAYGLSLVPLVLFTGTRLQMRVAVGFALVAVIYPLLRGGGYVPVDTLLDWASAISPERAASLAYRFENEAQLLERASSKPWLGWGGWGRNLVHDPETYEILTIPDGRWIIVFGTYGWLGYVSEFGLLSLPIFLLGIETLRSRGAGLSRYAATIAVILGINMIDMLLNATLTPVTWLLAGAALGHAEMLRTQRSAADNRAITLTAPVIGQVGASTGRRSLL